MTRAVITTTIRYDDIETVWSVDGILGANGWEYDLLKNGAVVATDLNWDDIQPTLCLMCAVKIPQIMQGLRRNKAMRKAA